ncbi:MAG TPA: ABC transporter substrate-binding protein [Acidimicrobiales bacterium]|nr:ABC transporter substrate-binding protein [Acidimicrobiales bacterium]
MRNIKALKTGPVVAVASVLALLAAGCSSNSSGSPTGSATGSTTGSAAHTYTIGLLTDLTGVASTNNQTSVEGVKAGVHWAAQHGYNIKYVVADTASSPSGVSSAINELVQQDHVFAVVSVSSLTFLDSNSLTAAGIPVVGAAEDGPEWITAPNMFSVFGPIDFTRVATTSGLVFKNLGATNVGTIGYGISPSSSGAAASSAASARAVGLKTGYVNTNLPFGSTNVGPVVLGMKSAGVNGVSGSVDSNTFFSLVTGLKQSGANLKVALSPTGYGGDILNAGPGAVQSAQGVYFLSSFEPVEMQTAATQQFQSNLKAVGVHGDPTYGEYVGYTSIGLLVQGLEAAGSSPTQASLIKGLSGITNFNALGLFGSHTLDLSDRTATVIGVDNCYWITKLSGSTFDLVPGMDPICGTIVQGKTVSP